MGDMTELPDESKDYWISTIASFAPEHLSTFRNSPNTTLDLIAHKDPRVRAAAIMAGHAMWHLHNEMRFVTQCCDVAVSDDLDEPRQAAIAVLHAAFENSKHSYVQQALGRIVRASQSSTFLRNCAYRAMLAIDREKTTTEDILADGASHREDVLTLMRGGVARLIEIDWGLVNRLGAE